MSQKREKIGAMAAIERGAHTGMEESDTIEFKQTWSENPVYDLAAFANTKGGTVHIGVDKQGYSIKGTDISDKAQQAIANKILAQLSIAPSISVVSFGDVQTLAVSVPHCPGGVWLRGNYYTRSGTVTTHLPKEQMARVILRHINETWDALPSNASIEEIDVEKVRSFIRSAKARPNPRLPDALH